MRKSIGKTIKLISSGPILLKISIGKYWNQHFFLESGIKFFRNSISSNTYQQFFYNESGQKKTQKINKNKIS